MEKRQISTTRKTKETDIQVTLNLDGSGIFRHDGSFYPVQMKFFKHKLNTKSKGFAGVSSVPVCRGKANSRSHRNSK